MITLTEAKEHVLDSLHTLPVETVDLVDRTLRSRLATGGTMKLSARNQLNGTVEAVDHGAVTTTIKIRLQGGDLITSSITKEAADDLQLKAGSAVIAVIKSSDVIVAVA